MPGSDKGGGEYSPIRSGIGWEEHGLGGPGFVFKAAAGRLSYAAAVSGLVENHVSYNISQLELGDYTRPGLGELRRQRLEKFRRPILDDFSRPDLDHFSRPNSGVYQLPTAAV